MLKIKDNVDLKELEKLGFIEEYGEYFYNFKDYSRIDYSYLFIDYEKRIFTDYVEYEHIDKMTELLFDLIQAGYVEKIEE